MEPGRNDEENRFSSVIELFHYSVTGSSAGAAEAGAAEATALLPCSTHSDASLLTLIPRCTSSPGLQLYNWSASAWQAVEAQSSEEEAIVFPGDMMQRVSNGGVIASPHRVAFDLSGPSAQEQRRGDRESEKGLGGSGSRSGEWILLSHCSLSLRRSRSVRSLPSLQFSLRIVCVPLDDRRCRLFPSLASEGKVCKDCLPAVSAMEALSEISRNLVGVNKSN